MKKISIISVCAIAAVSLAVGCVKNRLNYGDIQKFDDTQTLLKVNYASQYANNRSVYFKINGQRVSYLVTGRTPFPGGGYNTGGGNSADFMQVAAGAVQFAVALPHKVDDGTDSLELYSTTLQLQNGIKYIANVTDTLSFTKVVLTQENTDRPDTALARYHFIHLMPNVPAIDLYYGTATASDQSTDSLIVGNLAYLQNTPDFFMKAGVTKTWKIRPAGAAKTLATILASYSSASSVSNQRVYEIYTSGYSGKVSPSTQRPYVSFTLVR